jgi:alpha-2-macroglobulin
MFGLLPTARAAGEQTKPEGEASGYSQYRGEPFFLLGDTSYGTNEEARVRFEVPGRDFGSFAQYGGADIVLYQIVDPLEFLKQQKNLHRIKTDGNYVGEGLSNTISFLWDDWYRKSRRIWQNIFTPDARRGVTKEVPQLHTPATINQPTGFTNQPQFALLPEKNGFKFVQRFRYPLMHAQAIQPPAGVKLAGSSSDFGMSKEGNVHIPLGKLQPGLYLVEAIVGGFRANTLVFVADTVAISKTSADQMMVWTARRDTGAEVPDVQLMWTDGIGVLASGKTDARGIASFDHTDPEKSYIIGRDAQGGVLISENFYYDSEIYNTKIYAMTDRPLYRPGDEVNVKFLARLFTSARKSDAVAQGNIELEVLDPNGTPVATQKLQISAQNGAQTVFRLPENASAGGYELRYVYKDSIYSAAFRVAEYIKPHFEISVQPDKDNFKTNDTISGRLVLTYPDGKPVKSAQVQLTVRAQTTTMVEGEMQYTGLFPVKLQTEALVTDSDGVAKFSLPAAKEPSRYVLTTFASDGAAYRVKATKELLVERSASVYQLKAAQQFSQPNTAVQFDFESVVSSATPAIPVRYEIVRLETQSKSSGKIDSGAKKFSVNLPDSGSYTVMIYDDKGNVLGATSHWVAGEGVKVVKGSIEIVFDHVSYKPGDTAEALITFPEPVDSALLTLERDRVEQSALIQGSDKWIAAQRVAPTQWRAKIKVSENMAPNMTFSVAYVKNNEWVFQNRGILVEQPRIQVTFKTDREVYQPGETVKVQVQTQLDGKPVAANVSVGVVDEMIYVLQPEITPNIFDFFYHPRRNNVRTHSSLQFISYDLASYRKSAPPSRGSSRERGIKVLERPRRDNIDTAYWNGQLSTDSKGFTSFTFVMPDSLTRWRITGRAISAQGQVGQRTAYLRSEKSFYAKWISPNWMRNGDAPIATLAVFNQTEREQTVEIKLSGSGYKKTETLKTKRGINTLSVALEGLTGDTLHAEIRAENKLVDMLDISLRRDALEWKSPRTLALPVTGKQLALNLPKDASNIRLSFAGGAAQQFARIVDDLDDYPYGFVEQTASRLLPLSYALQSLPQDSGGERAQITRQLRQRLQHQRLRLVYMAGPNATFGWWGNATQDDLLLTAYAYYADYTASRVLGLSLPAEHWNKLLSLFGGESTETNNDNQRGGELKTLHLSRESKTEPASLTQRTLALWMASDMGLPSRTLVSGLLDDLGKQVQESASAQAINPLSSPVLLEPEGSWSRALTLKLATLLAEQHNLTLPVKMASALSAAQATLEQSALPSAQALLLLGSKGGDRAQAAERILESVRAEMPTFDRALTLIWLNKVLAGKVLAQSELTIEGPWLRSHSTTGTAVWRIKGSEIPASLSLAQEPTAALTAYVQYESATQENGKLAVKVERELYRLEPRDGDTSKEGTERRLQFDLSELSDGDALQTNDLYLEEITLTPEKGTRVSYGLVEVPLPPGAEVESSTWGVSVDGDKPLERASNQPSRGGYAIPVESLTEPLVVRHLLRFSQKGKFNLPPARFYSMYAPQNKAFESAAKPRVVTVK